MSQTRVGTKWSTEEETELIDQIGRGLLVDEIASLHQRNAGGIRTKILSIAHRWMTKEGQTFDQVASKLKISQEELDSFNKERESKIDRKKNKKQEASEKSENSEETQKKESRSEKLAKTEDKHGPSQMDLLVEIRDLLKIVVSNQTRRR